MNGSHSYLPAASDQLAALFLVQNDELGNGLRGRRVAADERPEHPRDRELPLLGRPVVDVTAAGDGALHLDLLQEVVEDSRKGNAALRRRNLEEPSTVSEREGLGFHFLDFAEVMQIALVS